MKSNQIGIRVSDDHRSRIDRVTDRDRNPYAPTITQLIERGIELALKELEPQKVAK